jgi:hypothetical protein
MLMGEVQLEFYDGDVERASARVNEVWERFHAAQIQRIGLVRVQLHYLRAASSVGAATLALERGQKAKARDLFATAKKSIAKLRGERLPLAPPLALLMQGAYDAAFGRKQSAGEHLGKAADIFEQQGFWTAAVAARARRGQVEGDAASEVVIARAEEALRAEGVVNPGRMLNLLAPGFARRSTP